jgi:hypothetical protein
LLKVNDRTGLIPGSGLQNLSVQYQPILHLKTHFLLVFCSHFFYCEAVKTYV